MDYLAVYCFIESNESGADFLFCAMPFSVSDEQADEALERLKEETAHYTENYKDLSDIRALFDGNEADHHLFVQHLYKGRKPRPPAHLTDGGLSLLAGVLEDDGSIPTGEWYAIDREKLGEKMKSYLEEVSVEGFKDFLKQEMKKARWPDGEKQLFKAVANGMIELAYDRDRKLKLIYVDFDNIASISFESLDRIGEVFEEYCVSVSVSNHKATESLVYRKAKIKAAMVPENKVE